MPRFEQLMDGQGRIRLLRKSADTSMMANYYLSVCRGWQIFQLGLTPRVKQGVKWWEYDMGFRPVPEGVDERGRVLVLDSTAGAYPVWRPIQRYAEADFDAMLASLQPYELLPTEDDDRRPTNRSLSPRRRSLDRGS